MDCTFNAKKSIRVGDIDINYEIADYTAPWRATPPETSRWAIRPKRSRSSYAKSW
ncbi:MAG: hypothetical protein HYS65_01130 [Betaproteobacteria bacterium]|nr:hypothetical protein [Betaproteobacteria bacterium]